MIAGEDYKRASAAGFVEPRAVASESCPLRLSWALSRVAALPTPDLADRLAGALLELTGHERAVALQIGRFDASGAWHLEQCGLAGRVGVGAPAGPMFEPHHRVPWGQLLEIKGGPVHGVASLPEALPAYRPIDTAMRRVGLGLDVVAVACMGPGSVVLTLQLGGHRRVEEARARAASLSRVLPWVLAIVRSALGEGEGRSARAWLTQREGEVLDELVGGRSVAEIARALGRSHYTVHDHVKSLHRKLGVHSRAALVGCATMGVPPPGGFE